MKSILMVIVNLKEGKLIMMVEAVYLKRLSHQMHKKIKIKLKNVVLEEKHRRKMSIHLYQFWFILRS